MGGTSRHSTNKCARCDRKIKEFPKAAACAECRLEQEAGFNPFLCEACFFDEMQDRSSKGILHKYDMVKDRIYRVGRIPLGSDDEEDKQHKPK